MATGDRSRDRETDTPGGATGDADDEQSTAEHPPLGASAEAAVAALFDAGPEAAEHLLKAAQELLLVAKLREDFPAVAAVGVGAAGLVDRDGDVQYAPNIPAFRRTPLREALGNAIGLPVVVDNDANAAAWGEIVHGAARGALYALMVTLGSGIGGGIVARGRVIRGAHGFAAEVG